MTIITTLPYRKTDLGEYTCGYCGRKSGTIGWHAAYGEDGCDFCSERCARLWLDDTEAKWKAKRDQKWAEEEARRKAAWEKEQAAAIAESEAYMAKRRAQQEEEKRQREEASRKAREAYFRIEKMKGWENTKIDPEKRRKFINETLDYFKCKCCGKISPELIVLRRSDEKYIYYYDLNSTEACEKFATDYKPVVLGPLGLGKYLNSNVMHDQDDFEAAKQALRDKDLFKEDIEVFYADKEKFDGHLRLISKNCTSREKGNCEESDYLLDEASYSIDKPLKIRGRDFVSKKSEIYTSTLDKEIKKHIKPKVCYCCSAECKKKLQEKAKKEYNEKYNELKKLYMDSINPVIEAQKKARKKALKIGIAAVAGWFLLLGILIGMSKDSFDYWDKTQYANNSYPCYEFATFANKDGVFYHTENKKYAISLAYVENPIEVPDEVTEDTYKDYIQVLEKQMNYGDSQENDEKFERKKLKKLLGKTQWLDDFPTGERLVFCIDVAELGKKSIKHKYAFVRIRLDDWGKIESVSNATNVYRYYTAVYNK